MALTLKKFVATAQGTGDDQHVWPLKVEATSDTPGLTSAVFKYHYAGPDDPYEGDIYEGVCNVADLGEIPVDAPRFEDGEVIVPYYRKAVAELRFRSPEALEDAWLVILECAQSLVNNFAITQDLTEEVEVSLTPETS